MPIESGVIALILNAGSGAGEAATAQARLEELFVAAGHTVQTTLVTEPDDLRRGVEAAIAAKVQAVVAGGGDGTISAVAGALVGRAIPLGVVPLGTLNHFAKDLGLPLELDAAADVVLAGRMVRVDVGEVNGRVFLNNSGLGLYPLIVRLREQRPARGPRKWVVAAWATMRALRKSRAVGVRLTVDGAVFLRRTPLLFVGNNEYRMAGFDAGSRESLTGGRLALYIVKARGRTGLIQLAWKVLAGTAHRADELDMLLVEAATIEARQSRLPVSLDGEVETFDTPLEYRIRPAALNVLVPALLPGTDGLGSSGESER